MAYLHRRETPANSPGLHVWWMYARWITLAMQVSVGSICAQTAWFRDALGDGNELHSSPEMGAFTSLALLAFLTDLVDAVLELREEMPRDASLEATKAPPVPSAVPEAAIVVDVAEHVALGLVGLGEKGTRFTASERKKREEELRLEVGQDEVGEELSKVGEPKAQLFFAANHWFEVGQDKVGEELSKVGEELSGVDKELSKDHTCVADARKSSSQI